MNPKASSYRSDLDDRIVTLNYFVYVQTQLSFKEHKGYAYLPYSLSTEVNRRLHNLPRQVVEMSQRQDQP